MEEVKWKKGNGGEKVTVEGETGFFLKRRAQKCEKAG